MPLLLSLLVIAVPFNVEAAPTNSFNVSGSNPDGSFSPGQIMTIAMYVGNATNAQIYFVVETDFFSALTILPSPTTYYTVSMSMTTYWQIPDQAAGWYNMKMYSQADSGTPLWSKRIFVNAPRLWTLTASTTFFLPNSNVTLRVAGPDVGTAILRIQSVDLNISYIVRNGWNLTFLPSIVSPTYTITLGDEKGAVWSKVTLINSASLNQENLTNSVKELRYLLDLTGQTLRGIQGQLLTMSYELMFIAVVAIIALLGAFKERIPAVQGFFGKPQVNAEQEKFVRGFMSYMFKQSDKMEPDLPPPPAPLPNEGIVVEKPPKHRKLLPPPP